MRRRILYMEYQHVQMFKNYSDRWKIIRMHAHCHQHWNTKVLIGWMLINQTTCSHTSEVHSLLITTLNAVSSTILYLAENQYLEIWCKLFWALLYTSNVMCSMCQLIRTTTTSLWNEWYGVKKTLYKFNHCVVPAVTNIWKFDVNSFGPSNMHLMWCIQCVKWS